MTSWDFLLQKQGDKSWLPLESPTLEILEGSYRLASRSSFAQTLVDIHIRYVPESGYKPLQHKTSKQVSPEGLLLIMPYTTFTPGLWQITCGQGEAWHKTLQFEVLSVMVEGSSPDWQEFVEELAPDRILPKHLINLDQIQYLVTGQQDITIAGEAYVAGEIEISLKNPQNLSTVVSSKHLLQGDSDRLVFSYNITIPNQSESQVAIGEVRLRPQIDLNLEDYVTYQSIMVTCRSESSMAAIKIKTDQAPQEQIVDEVELEPEIVNQVNEEAIASTIESTMELTVELIVESAVEPVVTEPAAIDHPTEPEVSKSSVRIFPLLPFEAIPPHVTPIKRNIKLPELPKFLMFTKKARNLPPWSATPNLSTIAPNYYEPEEELHYEFEEESTTISKPASNVIHLVKSRPKS